MKKDKLLVGVVVGVVVLLVGLVVYFGFLQSAIGEFPTLSGCQAQLANYCAQSTYGCTACAKTGSFYTAQCTVGSYNMAGNVCKNEENVKSHTGSGCYNNNLYWYNSVGTKETVKENCENGCSTPYRQGYWAYCNGAPVNPPSGIYPNYNVGAMCLSGNRACSNAGRLSASDPYYCPAAFTNDCSKIGGSCSNGVCIKTTSPKCSDECSRGSAVCVDDGSFKVCKTNSANSCLVWSDTVYCAKDELCADGESLCVPKDEVIDGVSGGTSGGTSGDTSGGTSGGNLCDPVQCKKLEGCDASGNYNTESSCSEGNDCIFGKVETTSSKCMDDHGIVVNKPASWLEKYGLYVGIGLLFILGAAVYGLTKKKKR